MSPLNFSIKCSECRLSQVNCICAFRPKIKNSFEFALLFHPKEINRQTNTGRLIAEAFTPATSYIWSRLNPPAPLVRQIEEGKVRPWLVYPGTFRHDLNAEPPSDKPDLFIIIDATWQQASKMVRKSDWLRQIPRIELNINESSSYLLRKNQVQSRVCTAETAIYLLKTLGKEQESSDFSSYYQRFMTNFIADKHHRLAPPLLN